MVCSLLLVAFTTLIKTGNVLAEEVKSERTEMIQAACSYMMSDIEKKYGRTFICHTSNRLTAAGDSAIVNEYLHMESPGFLIRFYNMSYEDPANKAMTLYYSYDADDYNAIVSSIRSGKGLTHKQIDFQVCKSAVIDFEVDKYKNEIDYEKKKIDKKMFEMLNAAFDESISNFKKCAKENKPDNISDEELESGMKIPKLKMAN